MPSLPWQKVVCSCVVATGTRHTSATRATQQLQQLPGQTQRPGLCLCAVAARCRSTRSTTASCCSRRTARSTTSSTSSRCVCPQRRPQHACSARRAMHQRAAAASRILKLQSICKQVACHLGMRRGRPPHELLGPCSSHGLAFGMPLPAGQPPLHQVPVRVQQGRHVQHGGGGRDRALAQLHPHQLLRAAEPGRPAGAHLGDDGAGEQAAWAACTHDALCWSRSMRPCRCRLAPSG